MLTAAAGAAGGSSRAADRLAGLVLCCVPLAWLRGGVLAWKATRLRGFAGAVAVSTGSGAVVLLAAGARLLVLGARGQRLGS